MKDEVKKEGVPFDFERHRKSAVDQYARKRQLYEEFAWEIENILTEAIETCHFKINEIQSRAKEEESFGKKAMSRHHGFSRGPRYYVFP